jgi:hypothetical protein
MIGGPKKRSLTPESILQVLTAYDIFKFYMPEKDWKINKVTYSPFRDEKNPSFVIGNKYGSLSFIDFAESEKRGDCFQFVKLLFNYSTIDDVLRRIDQDFGLGISTGAPTGEYKKIISTYHQPEESKRYAVIQVVARKFTKEELAYWNQYHQDITDLRENDIYSIKKLYLNKQLFPLKETELRFAYLYEGQYFKIYRPFAESKKHKWLPNNVPITVMDGKKDIINCDTAFINKSKKDYMVMKKVFPCSCAVQNEGIACFSPENVEYLKANSNKQILGFDSDVAGVKNSQQITKLFGFDYCNVPRKYLEEDIKDYADLAKIHGMKAVEEVLKQKGIL